MLALLVGLAVLVTLVVLKGCGVVTRWSTVFLVPVLVVMVVGHFDRKRSTR